MALINRIARLFTADVHAVLDRLEEPDILLKHAVREMEDELARGEQHAIALAHERDALADRQRKLRGALVEIAEQLDICFTNGNDSLARKVVKRKLEAERTGRHLAERQAALEEGLTSARTRLTEQREQLDLLRQKAELLAAVAPSDDAAHPETAVSDDEVEVALLRERLKRSAS